MAPQGKDSDEHHPEGALAHKVVLITGASSGIGRATARTLARRGARLVIAGRSEQRLEALATELDGEVLRVSGDLTDSGEVERLVSLAVDRFGAIDILFANAGIYIPGPVIDGDPADWTQLVDTNITSVLRLVHAVLGPMIDRGSGDIVVTSSISGHQAIHWEPVYSASKHAVQAFVHGLRRQVGPQGIRVCSIAPGRVVNELWGFPEGSDIDSEVSSGTWLRSEDVAEAVEFMLTRPRHVTVRDLVLLPSGQEI